MKGSMVVTLLARQGIYNQSNEVCAYELLYRGQDPLLASVDNQNQDAGNAATSSVVANLFANLSMETVVGSKPAFINFTRDHLLQGLPALLPKKRIVVEVLEGMLIDEDLIKAIHHLSDQGYIIALDDFIYTEQAQALVEVADIIKVDVLNLSRDEIVGQLDKFRQFNGQLLAEKIESREQFNICVALGFELFQGFYLNKPDPVQGQTIKENKANLLRLMGALHDPEVAINQVEKIILHEPKLSYRILRLANSASIYAGKKLDSLETAINHLGLERIRNWVILIMIASMDEVPDDLIERSLIRAKMCEYLASHSGRANSAQAYTVGMLSTLDAILNEPLQAIIARVPLSEEITEALLNKRGILGQILYLTAAYEQAEFGMLDTEHFKEIDVAASYLEGIQYATLVMKELR